MDFKRNRKVVIREEMVDLNELEQWLMNSGITKKELQKDLQGNLNLTPGTYGYKDSWILSIKGQEDIELSAGTICDFLDQISIADFQYLWENQEYHDNIAALIRDPGNMHEWLMVSALPYLKVMGIPMGFVKDYRDPVSNCVFWIDGKKGCHGRELSTQMHNYLLNAIKGACNAFIEAGLDNEDDSQINAMWILGGYLSEFIQTVSVSKDSKLIELIGVLKRRKLTCPNL